MPTEDELFKKASLLQNAGNTKEAESIYRDLIKKNPNHLGAISLLGLLKLQDKEFHQALEFLKRSLALNPQIAETHNYLGEVYLALDDSTKALQHIDTALKLNPDHYLAYQNKAMALQHEGQINEALELFETCYQIRRGVALNRSPRIVRPSIKCPYKTDKRVSVYKLQHDCEQLEYLLTKDLIPQSYHGVVETYKELKEKIPVTAPPNTYVELSDEQYQKIQATYQRALYLAHAPKLAGPAVNPNLDTNAIEADYFANAPGITAIDDFLTPEALQKIREFCLCSTIWTGFQYGTYLGAYMVDGFNCGLLQQIAAEMRTRLPKIFRHYKLQQMWGYKYDARHEGIPTHADFAAVNVNFWITPNEVNLKKDAGGLVVYKTEAPLSWDFKKFNRDGTAIKELLQQSHQGELTYEHKENRMVLFNSNLFHKTDTIDFKPGYTNRRINITMLFGNRELR